MGEKAERFGVSMPGDVLEAIDKVAAADFAGNRSAYLEALARADLDRRGLLPGSPVVRAMAKAKLAIEVAGADAVEARISELIGEVSAAEAAKVPVLPEPVIPHEMGGKW